MARTAAPPIPSSQSPLADIALAGDAYATVLDRHRLDFCCGGRRTLERACADAGLEVDRVLAELAAESRDRAAVGPVVDWREQPLPALIQHVVDTHHRFTREAVARIEPLLAKVAAKHGEAHPELDAVAGALGSLKDDLLPHLLREEQVVFPYIVALCAGATPPRPRFGTLANPVRAMTGDHEAAGALLEELRSLTSSFTPPPDACNSYRAVYAALSELRRDLMVHVALENEVLFPRALALAEKREVVPAPSMLRPRPRATWLHRRRP